MCFSVFYGGQGGTPRGGLGPGLADSGDPPCRGRSRGAPAAILPPIVVFGCWAGTPQGGIPGTPLGPPWDPPGTPLEPPLKPPFVTSNRWAFLDPPPGVPPGGVWGPGWQIPGTPPAGGGPGGLLQRFCLRSLFWVPFDTFWAGTPLKPPWDPPGTPLGPP